MLINSLGQLVHSDYLFCPMIGVIELINPFSPDYKWDAFLCHQDSLKILEN